MRAYTPPLIGECCRRHFLQLCSQGPPNFSLLSPIAGYILPPALGREVARFLDYYEARRQRSLSANNMRGDEMTRVTFTLIDYV